MSRTAPETVVTTDDARRSIKTARKHLEAAAHEVLWQVEHRVWEVLGYSSWDAMRDAEYGGVAVMVPSKERPKLTAALRSNGLTNQQVADTVGVSEMTVRRDLNRHMSNHAEPDTIPTARGKRPAKYTKGESAPFYQAPDPGPLPVRGGATTWSRQVQTVSATCPMADLTTEEVLELGGAVTFLNDYIRGELATRADR